MAVNGVMEGWMGTKDPAQGEMMQSITETNSHSSATGARDGAHMV